MKKQIVVAVVLAVLLTASAPAQTKTFFDIVRGGTPQDVQDAISKGADLTARNEEGQTPLMVAAMYNPDTEVINTLLKAGADVRVKDEGVTALILAAANNEHPEVITMLLQAGADIEARDIIGLTPLMWAAGFNSNPQVITTLLAAGANAKAKETLGKTALDFARVNKSLNGTDALKQLEEASK